MSIDRFGATYAGDQRRHTKQELDNDRERPMKFHRPGDRYVRAMLVLNEVDKDGNAISKMAAAEVTLRAGVLELAYCGNNKALEIGLMTQHAGSALHELIRTVPQASLVYKFEDVLSKG